MVLLYPAYVRKGYRMDWMLWICYPLTPIFSAAFGFFLQHFPRGGCFWLGAWLGYLGSANLIYNVFFSLVDKSFMFIYWILTISSVLGMIALIWKVKKEDKTFHLIWQAPIFGGYLCALSILIFA
jgi:hypothetical protein